MTLTPEGLNLLVYVRRILQVLDEAVSAIKQSGISGKFRLGHRMTMQNHYYLLCYLALPGRIIRSKKLKFMSQHCQELIVILCKGNYFISKDNATAWQGKGVWPHNASLTKHDLYAQIRMLINDWLKVMTQLLCFVWVQLDGARKILSKTDRVCSLAFYKISSGK